MKQNNRNPFCYPSCAFLSPTEQEQDYQHKKENVRRAGHLCRKYNKPVKHQSHHPKLVRLDECDYMAGTDNE